MAPIWLVLKRSFRLTRLYSTSLCQYLKQFVGDDVKCSNASQSFSKPAILSERFASSSTYQFYHPLFGPSVTIDALLTVLCSDTQSSSAVATLCADASSSKTAAHIDVDFDAISNSVTFTGFWTPSQHVHHGSKEYVADVRQEGDRLEIGVLQKEKVEDVEELAIGGFLHVVGESARPSKSGGAHRHSIVNLTGLLTLRPFQTEFSSPSRHDIILTCTTRTSRPAFRTLRVCIPNSS